MREFLDLLKNYDFYRKAMLRGLSLMILMIANTVRSSRREAEIGEVKNNKEREVEEK
jgi:hypothetical protein